MSKSGAALEPMPQGTHAFECLPQIFLSRPLLRLGPAPACSANWLGFSEAQT